jgi:hypothetical protein
MKSDVTKEQIAFYQENGYIIIEDSLRPDERETWRRQVDDAVAKRAGRNIADGKRSSEIVIDEESKYWDKVFVHRQNLWTDHEGMRALLVDARLGKLVSELARVDGMRIWHKSKPRCRNNRHGRKSKPSYR